MQPDNHVVQKFDTRKIYQLSNEVIFFVPFFVRFSLFAFNLTRRQSYAYAIGLYTRPEIKSWPDVKFCAHAQCVLLRCCRGETVWCTKLQVLPPEYLLPSQWVPGLAPIYVFLPRVEQVFTLQQTIARDRRGAASLRYRNSAEITVLMCEQKPLSGMGFVPAQKSTTT